MYKRESPFRRYALMEVYKDLEFSYCKKKVFLETGYTAVDLVKQNVIKFGSRNPAHLVAIGVFLCNYEQ